MTVRRPWILIGTIGLLGNGTRLAATFLGTKWLFFQYLAPIRDPMGMLIATLIVLTLGFSVSVAIREWRNIGAEETPYLEALSGPFRRR